MQKLIEYLATTTWITKDYGLWVNINNIDKFKTSKFYIDKKFMDIDDSWVYVGYLNELSSGYRNENHEVIMKQIKAIVVDGITVDITEEIIENYFEESLPENIDNKLKQKIKEVLQQKALKEATECVRKKIIPRIEYEKAIKKMQNP